MSNVKKLMMTAAGGDVPLNVEDVFSTYTWRGTSKTRRIKNNIPLGNSPTGTNGSSTEFDGSTDWLSKSSDLTSNSDGKTFTCSFWVWVPRVLTSNKYVYHTSDSWRNTIYVATNGMLVVAFYNSGSSGGTAFEIQAGNAITFGAWNHVLFSADLANTSLARLYINDVQHPTPSFSQSNITIDWTRSAHYIGYDATGATTGRFEGNLAHFYLDYTARNLDTESNRRLFINSAGGATSVSTQSALSPKLYLPMTSGYSVGQNLGTGGNFTANGTPTIVTNNGVEADEEVGQGGLVWIKNRDSGSYHHEFFDTERGPFKAIYSNQNWAEGENAGYLKSFNSDGFDIGTVSDLNFNGHGIASWTFRKAPKFFDVVTFTGTGSYLQTVPHSLGVAPALIIIKRLNSNANWGVWHRGNGTTDYTGLSLNASSPSAQQNPNSYQYFTDTSFRPTYVYDDSNNTQNVNGATYVAYLFAHNDGDGIFGPNGDQDIIKCGSYTGNGSNNGPTVNLGFEPQWLLIKSASGNNFWFMFDDIRGMSATGLQKGNRFLQAQAAANEYDYYTDYYANASLDVTSSGFKLTGNESGLNGSGQNYIYMAIRRGPMAVPTDATQVFMPETTKEDYTTDGKGYSFYSGFAVDSFFYKDSLSSAAGNEWYDRMRPFRFYTDSSGGEDTWSNGAWFDTAEGAYQYSGGTTTNNLAYMWRRAPNFYDYVRYAGTGTAKTISHNLGVVPEMMWIKQRNAANGWAVYHKDIGNTKYLALHQTWVANTSTTFWNSTTPTSGSFTVGTQSDVNASNGTYIAYLFASLDGISKVGSYAGSNSAQTIDCGFSSGARFVLIKNINLTNDWYVYDSARGIVAGNDPFLRLNSTSAENTATDYIDPHNSGFIVNGNIEPLNQSGSNYIFYAIA